MPFPCWKVRLIPHVHVTPNGIIIIPVKNHRLTWDGNIRLKWYSQPIRDVTYTANEPPICYGTACNRHLTRIWNLRISYPWDEIFLWDDDVTGAFHYNKFNPEIIGAFASVLLHILFISCGLQFGCTFSPANFEPIAQARQHLAEHLCDDVTLVDTHKDYLKLVKFSPQAGVDTNFTPAAPCILHTGVFDAQGKRSNPKHNMFLDNNLIAEIRAFISWLWQPVLRRYFVFWLPPTGITGIIVVYGKIRESSDFLWNHKSVLKNPDLIKKYLNK